MPESFIIIAEIEKTVLSAANGNNTKALERIYTNVRTWDKMSREEKMYYKSKLAQQLYFI